MIVICEECGKKYQINPDKIKGSQASFPCRSCNHRITVTKPDAAEPAVTPIEPTSPPGEPAGETGTGVETGASRWKKSLPPQMPVRSSRFGLTEKTVSFMLVVTLLPLLIYWGITFKQTSVRIRGAAEFEMLQRSQQLVDHVNQWIGENTRTLRTIASLPDMMSMAAGRQAPVLAAMRQAYPQLTGIATMGPDGAIVAGTAGDAVTAFAASPKLPKMAGDGKPAWFVARDSDGKPIAAVLALPIGNGNLPVVGVVAMALPISPLAGEMAKWRKGESGTAFLAETDGNAIVGPSGTVKGHPLAVAFAQEKRELMPYTGAGQTPLVGRALATANGWMLAIQAEQQELFRPLKQAQLFSYIYLMVTMLVVVIIAILAGRTMTRPIKQLKDAADRISVGELDVDIAVGRKDELGDLAEAVARMQDSLRLSIERIRQRK